MMGNRGVSSTVRAPPTDELDTEGSMIRWTGSVSSKLRA
jgi:hypothetical protein